MASTTGTQSIWHLRHVGPAATVENSSSIIRLPVHGSVTVGRGPTADYFLDSKIHLRLISRVHASISGEKLANGHVKFQLTNLGLNGTYINDFKLGTDLENTKVLHEGDKVVFGHVNSGSIQVGAYAPQPQSEFQFIFEKVNGFEEKHPRLHPHLTSCTSDVVQRIQLSTSVTKLEHGSVSPGSNGSISEKENNFCDIPINLSSNSTCTKSHTTATAFLDHKEKRFSQGQSLRHAKDSDTEETNVILEKNSPVPADVNDEDDEFKNHNFFKTKQRTLDYSDDYSAERDHQPILSRVEDNSNEILSKDLKTEVVDEAYHIPSENENDKAHPLSYEFLKKEPSDDPAAQEKDPSKSCLGGSNVKCSKDNLVTDMNNGNCNISEYSSAKPWRSGLPNDNTFVDSLHHISGERRVNSVRHFSNEEPEKSYHKCTERDKLDSSSVKADKKITKTKDLKLLPAQLKIMHSPVSVSEIAQCEYFAGPKQKPDPHSPTRICSERDKERSRSSFSPEHKHKHTKSRKVDKDKNHEQGSKPPCKLENLTVHHIDFGSGRHSSHSPNSAHRLGKREPSQREITESHSPTKLEGLTSKRHVPQLALSAPDSHSPTSKGLRHDPSHKHTSPRNTVSSNSPFSSPTSDELADVNPALSGSLCKSTSSSSPKISLSSSSSAKSNSVCTLSARSFVPPKDGLFDSSDEGSGEEGSSPVNTTPCIIKKIYSPLKKLHSKIEKENRCKDIGKSLSEKESCDVKRSEPDVKTPTSSLAICGKTEPKGKSVSKTPSSHENVKQDKESKDFKTADSRFANSDNVVGSQSSSSAMCTSPPVLLSPPREVAKDTNLPSSPPPLISPSKLSFLKSCPPQELKSEPEIIKSPDLSPSSKSHERHESSSKSSVKKFKSKLKAAKHSESTSVLSTKKSSSLEFHTQAEAPKKKIDDTAVSVKLAQIELSPLKSTSGFLETVSKSRLNKYKIPRVTTEPPADADQVDSKSPAKPSAVQDSSTKVVSSSSDKSSYKNSESKKDRLSGKKNQEERFSKAASDDECMTKTSNSKNQKESNLAEVSSTTSPFRPRACKSGKEKSNTKRKGDVVEFKQPPTKSSRSSLPKRKVELTSSEDDDHEELSILRELPKSTKSAGSPVFEAPIRRVASSRCISKLAAEKVSSVRKSKQSVKSRQTKNSVSSSKGKKRQPNKKSASKPSTDSSDDESPIMEDADSDNNEDAWNLPDGVQYFDNPCNAVECKNPSGKAVNWVMCDKCEQWYHLLCVEASLEDVQNENTQFVCGFC